MCWVKNFPDRTSEIDAQARFEVKQGGKGQNKWREEGDIADLLAGPRAADLPSAEKWARDAATHTGKISEASFDKNELKSYTKYKQPAPTAAAMHRDYAEMQANAMVPLADVLLHEGHADQAAPLLVKAYSLDPMIGEVSQLRGEIALDGAPGRGSA